MGHAHAGIGAAEDRHVDRRAHAPYGEAATATAANPHDQIDVSQAGTAPAETAEGIQTVLKVQSVRRWRLCATNFGTVAEVWPHPSG